MVGLRFLVPSIGVRVPVRQRCLENEIHSFASLICLIVYTFLNVARTMDVSKLSSPYSLVQVGLRFSTTKAFLFL